MKVKNILDSTTNRSVYNKARKVYLENKVEIHCAWCPYHQCENVGDKKYYYIDEEDLKGSKFPSWKLSTRNRKQWMNKKNRPRRDFMRFYGTTVVDVIDYNPY